MTLLSTLLEEAARPASDFVRREDPVYVLEDATGWMGAVTDKVQEAASDHAAYLKKHTGRGWKLFKRFLAEAGRLIIKFEVSRRGDIANDPMVILRVAFSRASGLYSVRAEVWSSADTQIASHEATDVDIDMLQDPRRLYTGIEKALVQLKPTGLGEARLDEGRKRLSAEDLSELPAGTVVTTPDGHRAWRKSGTTKSDWERVVPSASEGWRSSDPVEKGQKVFHQVIQTLRREGLVRDTKLREAAPRRLSLGAEGGDPTGDWRSNPTRSGPAAERARVLQQAKTAIERMLTAIDTVRDWVKPLGLGDKDKTGAAAAALKLAAAEIGKAESIQRVLGTIIELTMENPGSGWLDAMDEAADFVMERRKAPTADASRAKEGLARMIDGLRQLHGMLRQAKFAGRLMTQIEAAINGLKATRDAVDALFECGALPAMNNEGELYPPQSVFSKGFTRTRASEVRKGMWVLGGTRSEPLYRQIDRIERLPEDMAYVVLHFTVPYQGSDGLKHTAARFHKDAVISAAKP